MSETAHPTKKKGPRGPDDKEWVCPFSALNETSQVLRRQDLSDLAGTFREGFKPLREILAERKGLNVRYAASNRHLRSVTRFQIGISILSAASLGVLVIALGYAWAALELMEQHTEKLYELETQFREQTRKLNDLQDTANHTEQEVAAVKKEQESKPQLELVPETDPEKAKKAPVKLRVKVPTKPDAVQSVLPPDSGVSSGEPPPVAEIPLSPKAF